MGWETKAGSMQAYHWGAPGTASVSWFDCLRKWLYTSRFFKSLLHRSVSMGTGKRVNIMYAVIKTGGKQYKGSAGEKLKVETIAVEVGAEIVLDQVLLVVDGDVVTTGTSLVSKT